MGHRLDHEALDELLCEARSCTTWLQRPVTDEAVRDLYDLLKRAPAKVDDEFYSAGRPGCGCEPEFFVAGRVKANDLRNPGYGDPEALHPCLA